MSALTRKPVVVLLAVAGLLAALVATRATWVTGTVDGVAGPVALSGRGRDVAEGVVAVALVGVAAAVAAATAGRLVRWVAVAALAASAVGVAVLTLRVLTAPDLVLGELAARTAGGTGAFEATARASAQPWLAVAGAATQLLAALGATVGARRWGRLGGRYEREPQGEVEAAGPRGERVASDWDRLSRGEDPTT